MTPTTAALGILGAGFGLGLVLIGAGWRRRPATGRARASGRPWPVVSGVDQATVRKAGAGVAAGMLVLAVTGWLVGGALAAASVVALPRLLGRDRHAAGRVARVEAVASWTEMLRDTLAAAAGLEQTILATAGAAPVALRGEVRGLAGRLERGERLPAALRRFAEQVADPTADLVVSALVLAAEHQARQLADLLGELAREAREQVAMRLRIDAGRARTRTSVRVIVGTTLAFAIGLIVLNRPYLHPYDGAGGQLVLLLVGGLFAVAFWWLGRIGRVDENPRLLTNPTRTPRTEQARA